MSQEIKYTHEELVRAVDRIQKLGEFSKRVDASRKAGELLNQALDDMEKGIVEGVKSSEEFDSFDDTQFKL